jgi:phosphonate transport system substrate-binding protein
MKLFSVFILLIVFSVSGFSKSLKIGVTPYTNALKIIKVYEPLTNFLSKDLHTNVEVYTSSNYKEFYKDVEKGNFDIVITSPHFGALHIQNGFKPIYRYNTSLDLLFIVLNTSPYKKISDLKNTTIATPNPLAALNIGSIKTLLDNGLENGKNFTLENLGSHTSAIKSVLLGTTDAAITTHTPIKQYKDKNLLEKVRVLKSEFKMPHLFTLGSPKLSAEELTKIRNSLNKFKTSNLGINFFKKTGYKGYVEISKDDLKELKPILKDTKKYLDL